MDISFCSAMNTIGYLQQPCFSPQGNKQIPIANGEKTVMCQEGSTEQIFQSISCDENYHPQGEICVADVITYQPEFSEYGQCNAQICDGQGFQERSLTNCKMFRNSVYEADTGLNNCESYNTLSYLQLPCTSPAGNVEIPISNGEKTVRCEQGSSDQVFQSISCDTNYHPEGELCVSNIKDCSPLPEGALTYQQVWNTNTNSYNSCQLTCDNQQGYFLNNGNCVIASTIPEKLYFTASKEKIGSELFYFKNSQVGYYDMNKTELSYTNENVNSFKGNVGNSYFFSLQNYLGTFLYEYKTDTSEFVKHRLINDTTVESVIWKKIIILSNKNIFFLSKNSSGTAYINMYDYNNKKRIKLSTTITAYNSSSPLEPELLFKDILVVPNTNRIIFNLNGVFYVTDGTESGTAQVMLDGATSSSSIMDYFVFYRNNKIIFSANTANYYVWESDGTVEGTKTVGTKSNTYGALYQMGWLSDTTWLTTGITFSPLSYILQHYDNTTNSKTNIMSFQTAFTIYGFLDKSTYEYEYLVYGKVGGKFTLYKYNKSSKSLTPIPGMSNWTTMNIQVKHNEITNRHINISLTGDASISAILDIDLLTHKPQPVLTGYTYQYDLLSFNFSWEHINSSNRPSFLNKLGNVVYYVGDNNSSWLNYFTANYPITKVREYNYVTNTYIDMTDFKISPTKISTAKDNSFSFYIGKIGGQQGVFTYDGNNVFTLLMDVVSNSAGDSNPSIMFKSSTNDIYATFNTPELGTEGYIIDSYSNLPPKLINEINLGTKNSTLTYFFEYQNNILTNLNYGEVPNGSSGELFFVRKEQNDYLQFSSIMQLPSSTNGLEATYGVSDKEKPLIYNDDLYYQGNFKTNGLEIWMFDHNLNIHKELCNISRSTNVSNTNYNKGSNPTSLIESNGQIYFFATHTYSPLERKLWNYNPLNGQCSSKEVINTQILSDEDVLNFQNKIIYRCSMSLSTIYPDFELCIYNQDTDERNIITIFPTTNTTMASDSTFSSGVALYSNFLSFNNKIYFMGKSSFVSNQAFESYEIWETDGTIGGTKKSDINTYIGKTISNKWAWQINTLNKKERGLKDPKYVQIFKNNLYIIKKNNSEQWEIWKTDSTAGGTQKIYTMPLKANNYQILYLRGQSSGKIFFEVTNIDQISQFESKLYYYDENTIEEVKDANGDNILKDKILQSNVTVVE